MTHVVYAAVHELPGLSPGWVDEAAMQRNAAMLSHVMEPLLATADVRHVSLLQGTKAYGLHHPSVGYAGVRNPCASGILASSIRTSTSCRRTTSARSRRACRGRLTVFRPTVVYGDAIGTNMNLIPVIGAWAALLRERGATARLSRPGALVPAEGSGGRRPGRARSGVGCRVCRPLPAGTFNLTNGDAFRWQEVWPAIAETFGMAAVSTGRPCCWRSCPPGRSSGPPWSTVMGFAPRANIVDFVGHNSLVYADQLLAGHDSAVGPVLNSTIAVRQAGFHECMDTEDMFRKWFGRLQQERLLPHRRRAAEYAPGHEQRAA